MTEDYNVLITYSEDNPKATKKDIENKLKRISQEELKLKPILEKTILKLSSQINGIIKSYYEKYNLIVIPITDNGIVDLKIVADLRTFKYENFLQQEHQH